MARLLPSWGPSGTGKTTLLRLITGQLVPDCRVLIDEQDITKLKRNELYVLRKRFGMLFQNGACLPICVFENVAFLCASTPSYRERSIKHIVLTKPYAGLRGAADLAPSELPGGMARRVALARV